MATVIQAAAPSIRQDASGALRVGHSQVLVEIVLRAYQDGSSPEEIAQSYPAAALQDIYGVIDYYRRNTKEIDAYLERRERLAAVLRARIEGHQSQDSKFNELRRRVRAQKSS